MTESDWKQATFDGSAFQDALKGAIAKAFGPEKLPPLQIERLAAFGTWLADASRFVNLTRILTPEGMAVSHFLDTYQLLPLLEGIEGPVLDVGTGGGIPGLPLAVFRPALEVVMIDGTAKKVAFVRDWIKALGLGNAAALHDRAERHLKTRRYAAAVCRASVKPAAMMAILEAAGSGVDELIFMEGSKGKETAREIAPCARRAGYAPAALATYRLPGMDRERHLLHLKRAAHSPRRR